MVEKRDFDTIRKTFLIYDTNFSNHALTYTYQHRKTKRLLKMDVQFGTGDSMHLCGVDYYQIDKQGSCKSRSRATQFYRALKNSKVPLRKIRPKDDGTTDQKLQIIPLSEILISPGIRACDGGKFYNLQYEKAIRPSKMIVALICKENSRKYVS